jgi:hypothetical protein
MVKVRSWLQWLGASGALILAVVVVVIPGALVLDLVAIALGALLVVYWLTTPLLVGPDEVVARPHLRSRRIPRDEIVATESIKTQGWPSWFQLRLRLADGSTVMVDRVAQVRDGGAVDRARTLLS